MLIGPVIEFQPIVFLATFSISQIISIKFPDMKIFLMRKSKRLRVHHAFAGGLFAFLTSFIGNPFLFNISLGMMIQDIFNHSIKVLRKRFNF
jgi:hypothetical protein